MNKEKGLKALPKGKGIFWSVTKVFFVFVFIVGLIFGVYVCHYFVEPFLDSNLEERIVLLEHKVELQDKQINSCINCLNFNEIDLNQCFT